jgi:hypothetical protein
MCAPLAAVNARKAALNSPRETLLGGMRRGKQVACYAGAKI